MKITEMWKQNLWVKSWERIHSMYAIIFNVCSDSHRHLGTSGILSLNIAYYIDRIKRYRLSSDVAIDCIPFILLIHLHRHFSRLLHFSSLNTRICCCCCFFLHLQIRNICIARVCGNGNTGFSKLWNAFLFSLHEYGERINVNQAKSTF